MLIAVRVSAVAGHFIGAEAELGEDADGVGFEVGDQHAVEVLQPQPASRIDEVVDQQRAETDAAELGIDRPLDPAGEPRAKVGESGSFFDLVACGEWQSRQAGASGSFLAARVPWMLVLYCSTCAAWETPQSTFFVIVSQGRVCEGATSLWHCAQAVLACVELS